MKITFVNKFLSKILDSDSKELVKEKINAIMPQFIGENHHKFVERFLETGKYKMLNNRKE